MKKLLFIIFISLCLFACSGGNSIIDVPDENEHPNNSKEYVINLGLSGEISNIEDSPLNRATTGDLYGVQVYSTPSNGGEQKPYAYGLFDNKETMTIKLLDGYKYNFAISMVVNGKDRIFLSYSGNYEYPFYTSGGGIKLLNNFTYSLDKSLDYLHKGYASVKEGNVFGLYQRPNVDRYYGELSEYVPAENKSATIEMKRVVFGIKIIAEGLTEGSLITSIENSPSLSVIYPALETSEILSFTNTSTNRMAWTNDYYTENVPVSISWKKIDGVIVPLITQNITFKRNKQTSITVKVNDNAINNGVDISKDNTPMVSGDDIIIDTSNGTDTGVNP